MSINVLYFVPWLHVPACVALSVVMSAVFYACNLAEAEALRGLEAAGALRLQLASMGLSIAGEIAFDVVNTILLTYLTKSMIAGAIIGLNDQLQTKYSIYWIERELGDKNLEGYVSTYVTLVARGIGGVITLGSIILQLGALGWFAPAIFIVIVAGGFRGYFVYQRETATANEKAATKIRAKRALTEIYGQKRDSRYTAARRELIGLEFAAWVRGELPWMVVGPLANIIACSIGLYSFARGKDTYFRCQALTHSVIMSVYRLTGIAEQYTTIATDHADTAGALVEIGKHPKRGIARDCLLGDEAKQNERKLILRDFATRVENKTNKFEVSADEVIFRTGMNEIRGPSGQGKSVFCRLFDGSLDEDATTGVLSSGGLTKEGEIRGADIAASLQKITTFAKQKEESDFIVKTKYSMNEFLGEDSVPREMFDALGVDHLVARDVDRSLSGGEQKRLLILRTVLAARRRGSKVVVFDEPDAALDAENCKKVVEFIRKYLAGLIVIVIVHGKEIREMLDAQSITQAEAGKVTQVI